MDDAQSERARMRNYTRIIARALDACTSDRPEAGTELEFLLSGPHARPVVLGILEFLPQTKAALKRGARLWLPFGGKEYLLYELATDRSRLGLLRIKNLLEAGWDPNHALPGTKRTALMQAINGWTPENRTLVAMLLAAGADTTQASASGMTVFDDAPTVMRAFIDSALKDLKQDATGRKRA